MPAPQVITFIIGSAVVIFGAYFVTYLLARGSQKVYRGRVIQVLDRFSLAKDKSLMLIAVYDKIYLVAFSGGNVTLLDNIDPETAAALAAGSQNQEINPKQPGDLVSTLLSRARRRTALKTAAREKQGSSFPYEAYLPGDADNFFDVLQNSLNTDEHREGDDR